jgi:hypothetical protein
MKQNLQLPGELPFMRAREGAGVARDADPDVKPLQPGGRVSPLCTYGRSIFIE